MAVGYCPIYNSTDNETEAQRISSSDGIILNLLWEDEKLLPASQTAAVVQTPSDFRPAVTVDSLDCLEPLTAGYLGELVKCN